MKKIMLAAAIAAGIALTAGASISANAQTSPGTIEDEVEALNAAAGDVLYISGLESGSARAAAIENFPGELAPGSIWPGQASRSASVEAQDDDVIYEAGFFDSEATIQWLCSWEEWILAHPDDPAALALAGENLALMDDLPSKEKLLGIDEHFADSIIPALNGDVAALTVSHELCS